MTDRNPMKTSRGRLRPDDRSRRGVASVLAMMFLVIFSSLAAAMAVVAQGNLRTADSSLKVNRAMSAAETGLVFAAQRLSQESSRFIVEKGVISDLFAHDLWLGEVNEGADGNMDVLPPKGYTVTIPPAGLAEAVRDGHIADSHSFIIDQIGDPGLPNIDGLGTLRVKPIRLEAGNDELYFRLKYELITDEPLIRVTSQGIDRDITRTLQLDFRIDKKIEFAIISPNRIMIGKNVRVEGPLGSRYGMEAGELDPQNGDPLVMRSDFYDMTDNLDEVLDLFYDELKEADVDGDGRLAPDHPEEAVPIDANADLMDYNGDEYVDDFDLFLAEFDTNNDFRVVYDAVLSGGMSVELPVEHAQLARLIDDARADRDGDGEITTSDEALGYHNGVIDVYDLYAKVHGRLLFAVAREDWEVAHDDAYQSIVHGPVRTDIDEAPVIFEAPDEELRSINTEMVADAQQWFEDHVVGATSFDAQVQANVDAGVAAPVVGPYEAVPFGSQGAYDFYERTIYTGMTFDNLTIPQGNNGLFVDCIFLGVTFVDTEEDCGHENWNYAGALQQVEGDPPTYEPKYPGLEATLTDGTPVPDTRLRSNNIRFDGCTFLGSVSGIAPDEYTHWRNKLQFTGQTRFYVDSNDPDLEDFDDGHPADLTGMLESLNPGDVAEMEKSSLLLPGWSLDVGNFDNSGSETDVVKLKGTIIAGILDVRGTADVHGTLIMTFRPIEGEGPLFYGGLTDAFNTTIGYFSPTDGDGEGMNLGEAGFVGFGEITLRYNPDARLPDGIPWPVRVDAEAFTYFEGGSM